jgi:ribonucleoside-triphosphate reductase
MSLNTENEILSDITVYNKYAKHLADKNRRETWLEVVERNREMHNRKFPFFKEDIAEAYEYVANKKILPSLRSCQFAGRAIELSPSRMFNCAYLPIDHHLAFSEIMFLLLGGTGVGYSVQYHHVEKLPTIKKPKSDKPNRFLIQDSIVGWSDAIKVLMKSYFNGTKSISFDYSDIRKKGTPLKTAGGRAPGPEPLRKCITNVRSILNEKENGSQLSPLEVHDIVCHIADAVLAGGIRRAALISLFSADDQQMISCKFGSWWEHNPQRGRSNNSAVLLRHRVTKDFFLDLWKKVELSNSGEPGLYFSNDAEFGVNPCVEIALRPFQFCNLTEVNVSDVKDQEDLENRVRMAARIATIQASYTDFHYLRPIWRKTTEKDALLGVSMTGIASGAVERLDLEAASRVVEEENKRVANIIGIKPAARRTCIKPAGTSSLVLGCSSGIHAWHNDYYIRRMRILKNEPLYLYLAENHPDLVEDDVLLAETACIKIPQKAPEGSTTRHETALELLSRVKRFTESWVWPGHTSGSNKHNISATVSIRPTEWQEVGEWMWENREYFNGLSVIPYDGGSYTQAPFEDCDRETYERMCQVLHKVDLSQIVEFTDETDLSGELACAGGSCEIK